MTTLERRRPYVTVRTERMSFRVDVRACVVLGLLVVVTLAVGAVSLTTGDFPVPLADVVRSLTGRGDTGTDFIVLTLRLPRLVGAILVGAALGVSGAIFQGLTRNPLGSPDFIGLTTGAATGALVVILVVGGSGLQTAAGALIGCTVTSVAVYLLAFKGGASGVRLILVGVGFGAMLDAFNSFLITRARLDEALQAQVWQIGSLNGRGWEVIRPLVVALVVLLPISIAYGRRLVLLGLGDDTAHALGVPVERTRGVLVACSVGLAAVATAAAGPIGFIALAAPQLARRVTRTSGSGLVAAAVMGAALLTVSDWAAQRMIPGHVLPVGVATGAVGGVYLTWILYTEWRRRT